MPFPLTFGDRTFADPAGLASFAREEAIAPTLPERPCDWVPGLVRDGALEARLATALSAAFLQHAEAATICEGARLAVRLRDPVLGPILLRALQEHDTALLLQPDPADADRSVEDTLLHAAPAVVDLEDAELRRPLLEALRNAGLPEVEIPVLARHGDATDLRQWLPAVLAEGLSGEHLALLEERASGEDEAAAVVGFLLGRAG
ncbi:MAG: hypothetical protein H6735_15300 [Alphaproteobacteria bacterium]|nr:hypothetical protein [Alphaproteobacteria bacterium]